MRKVGKLLGRHPAIAAAAGLVAGLVLLLLVAGGGSGEGDKASPDSLKSRQPAAPSSVGLEPAPAPAPDPAVKSAGETDRETHLHRIAAVQPGHRVELRRSPGGQVIAKLGDRTEFGSDRYFWLARRRGGWLGVPSAELPDGGLGWIRDDRADLKVYTTPYWIQADISDRVIRLWRGRRVVDRIPVTVGAPGSPTPPGRYSVTDGLTTSGLGGPYGCCVLALSGHQPNLPPGWLGGDRIAIHGTPGSIGGASSGGCLRASNADMVSLFQRIPLGTPVLIRR